MAVTTFLERYYYQLPIWLLGLTLSTLLVFGIVLTTVRLYTTYRYRHVMALHSLSAAKTTKPNPPPPIPYSIPFLGHAIGFLAPYPGEFWSQLFRSHPRTTGACSLLLGGKHSHILFSPSAVQALFKGRELNHDGFSLGISELGFGLEHNEAVKFFGFKEGADDYGVTPGQQRERVNHKYMLEKKSVNELTAEFTGVLREQLAAEKFKSEGGDKTTEGKVEHLYSWLQARLFQASTTAFMGSRILEICPNLRADFFQFERHMLTMFFRVPKWLSPTAYKVRERTLEGLVRWQRQMLAECNDNPADPDGSIDWEPVFGSRANRARQRYYASRDLNLRARAGMDLGFLFGLSSNAIPAVGWMLMHILNPQGDASLPGRVMDELATAERSDGSLDIPTLVALPLLQSVYHEILRLYMDVLVTRDLKDDIVLPLDDSGQRKILLEKGSVVLAPTWLGHRDEALWTNPPYDQFHAERFLQQDPGTGKQIFTTNGTAGKFFPFGGGKTMCPGRNFAKQEVLGSVATILLTFDLEPLGFVDEKGRSTSKFPGLRKSYTGSGIMATDADMMVRIKQRRSPTA